MATLDTVIVGAGQAGLGVSYFFQRDRRPHVVFERGRIGESWLAQRWDSFQLNTPNLMNVLPGLAYDGPEPDGFWQRDELIHYFRQYVEQFQLDLSMNEVFGQHRLPGLYFSWDETAARAVFLSVMA